MLDGRYRLDARIAAGGMGEVWRGTVLLKVTALTGSWPAWMSLRLCLLRPEGLVGPGSGGAPWARLALDYCAGR